MIQSTHWPCLVTCDHLPIASCLVMENSMSPETASLTACWNGVTRAPSIARIALVLAAVLTGSRPAVAQCLVETIETTDAFATIAFAFDGHRGAIASQRTFDYGVTAFELDGSNISLLPLLAIGPPPRAIAWSGDELLVSFGGASDPLRRFQLLGGDWQELPPIERPPDATGQFGRVMTASADFIVVSDVDENVEGQVYVYARSGGSWLLVHAIPPSSPHPWAQFGLALDLDGGQLIVGRWSGDGGTAAEIIELTPTSWTRLAEIPLADDAFPNVGDVAIVQDQWAAVSSKTGGSGSVTAIHGSASGWAIEDAIYLGGNFAPPLAGDGDDLFITPSNANTVAHWRRGPTGWSAMPPISSPGDIGGYTGFGIGLASRDGRLAVLDANAVSPSGGVGAVHLYGGIGGTDCNADGISDFCDLLQEPSDDCNANGLPDDCDIAGGTSVDLDENGIPDECQPDCNGNGLPDFVDLAIELSRDCNLNGIPDECDIAGGTSLDLDGSGVPDECEDDCNANAIPDWLELLYGLAEDCDADGVPDECGADCNANGIADACDITDGTSLDCDADGVPDECQPDCDADGTPDGCEILDGAADCNANGVPDSCDIANGTVLDTNANGIPDDCECIADLTGNGEVNFSDLLDLLAVWGTCPGCTADLTNDGIVDFSDLLVLLAEWGPCT